MNGKVASLMECLGVEAISVGITEEDVIRALQHAQDNEDIALEDLLGLMAAKQAEMETLLERQMQEQTAGHDNLTRKVQWEELCVGLGLHECDHFMQMIEALSEEEKKTLSCDGGFFQQLIHVLDEDVAQNAREEENEEHPITKLQRLYPEYRIEVIENVLDENGYDVNAAAAALSKFQAMGSTRSYAAVVTEEQRAQMEEIELRTNGPRVHSLGHFPMLPSKPSQRSRGHKAAKKKQDALPNHGNVWHANQTPHGRSSLVVKLQLERLEALLPSIDRDIIHRAYYLNECDSDATEATLREVFHLPLPSAEKPAAIDDEQEDDASDTSLDDISSTTSSTSSAPAEEEWCVIQRRHKVEKSRQLVDDRYCALLRSFQKHNRVVALDKVRELNTARKQLRHAQRASAHDFFVSQKTRIRRRSPVDLHGLIVMEALQVVREIIDFCRAERIKSVVLICGAGNHSVNGKPRLLTAIQASCDRRGIAYRLDSSAVIVYPMRLK